MDRSNREKIAAVLCMRLGLLPNSSPGSSARQGSYPSCDTLGTSQPEAQSLEEHTKQHILKGRESADRVLEDYLLDVEYEETFRRAVLDVMCG